MATLPTAGRQPLLVELHSATRTEHALLNRNIIARIPLCLPSATSTPALYVHGMTVIGQMYYGIEEAWDSLLAAGTLKKTQRDLVRKLNIAQLRRTQNLRTSLAQLSASLGPADQRRISQLQSVTAHFSTDIFQSIIAKPHLLMAYTWTMYLALFNGGRWIAKQLLNAGEYFWNEDDRSRIVQGKLRFWFFSDDEDYDGEDIKIAFKEDFAEVADGLTDEERDEVIAEAKRIFGMCAEMITLLDEYVHTGKDEEQSLDAISKDTPLLSSSTNTLGIIQSLAPASLSRIWSSIMSSISSTQITIPIRLRQEVDHKPV